ncbi:winged helix-turn-helix domain-containing protein [Bradyrhizobium sp. Arg68]|uniref:ATP-binding protein n=1 Tax=Bradyrhizobium ivorense TaxID=2511166 RepID=UPI001E5639C7|nr:winged helix-turn-helix domain-containing protein [Bradyrhizobium ivorense]MCC8935665.1 winged helix-turn-helix domain-containing protein [Bradyrhizobium ivorense]
MARDHRQRSLYAYAGWEIDLSRREMRLRGAHVPLGGRAFDIIAVLVRAAGQLVTKEELLEQIWSGVFVEEIALRVHIAAIRKAFGSDRGMLETSVGRGYRLLGTWDVREPAEIPKTKLESVRALTPPVSTNLPTAMSRLIGRTAITAQLQELLSAYRVITLTGPGGIGKTVLALEAARLALPTLDGNCVVVELASISDPKLVPSAVARTLSLKLDGEETSADAVVRTLGNRRMLLVLDNCEHVVDAVAPFAETVVSRCPFITILATSRETLRIDGEYICRVPPLDAPSGGTSDAYAGSSAVELFLVRARALGVVFSTDEDRMAIAAICRRLDGIPLAIEFAAARAVTLGPPKVAASLDDRFNVLTTGRRTALPRHRTLRATLDWSYELLPDIEASVLCRLAVFAKEFSLDAAIFVVGRDAAEAEAVTDNLASLAAKSLVAVDLRGDSPQYRLLDTTRAYAMEKLRSKGQYRQAARRLAEFYIELFARADRASRSTPQCEWLSVYAPHLDNVRAALDWAFSPEGDARIGVALMAAAVPLWVQSSMLAECRDRVQLALAKLDDAGGESARLRMELSAALGWSLMYGLGRAREAGPAWTDVLGLAESLDDRDYQLRALWGLCIDQFNNGAFQKALQLAERFREVAATSNDAIELMMADRLFATTLHYIGDQSGARHHIDRVVAQLAVVPQRTPIVRFSFDVRVSTHYFQARILWLQGFAEQALRIVAKNIEEGHASGHALTFCSVLGQGACPLAYFSGDLDAADLYCAALLDHTERHPIPLWHLWAQCFKGMLMTKGGDIEGGLTALRNGLDGAGEARFLPRFLLPLGELAAGLGQAGRVGEGLAVVEDALVRCEAREERWYVAELLRIKGELLLRGAGRPSTSAAERCFTESLELARRQGALFWELRSSLNLARLRIDQSLVAEARAIVLSVYEKFTEGFDIADLRNARFLLDLPSA